MSDSVPSRHVVLLAHENMNVLDLTGPVQALHTANQCRPAAVGSLRYDITVASENGGLVTTSAGLQLMSVALASLDGMAIDTLMAPGGCRGAVYEVSDGLVAWVAARGASVRRLCSICTGAFLLAAAGQLDGRRAATHWDWAGRLSSLYPGVRVDADRIFVRDGNVWSSAGVTAGIDLTLALIEDDHGHRLAIDVARQLVVFVKRAGGQSQFSAPLSAQSLAGGDFAELHAWMAANLHDDLRVEKLAERMNLSPRTFARAYRRTCGVTPAKAVAILRLEAARRLLEGGSLPIKRIAGITGLSDEQTVRRAFLRMFGVTPSDYRDRFQSAAADTA
ncbi:MULTISPECIES: GlxA family transcriptional regulator [Xanthomonas]|uniref:GlxA family transcriptional regulator n=1 Tax=Xanthomonas TaxID=338 RepID=UPI00141B26DD|nr:MULTISPECIES: helix-turn-helix domain-containing protein [Xanthomonas]MEB1610948.1 helix-turn-helix domain-containing protein [Xanthomonas campestris pv. campestris]NIJ77180.1 transcriptional regulator GlxA family with amidase domain [Xanthomonas sp. CFBP 8151]CAD7376938.1 DJ-1/PfpI family protein [Xanthomonas arboricola]CAG2084564.1 DJ-1/PfpI family protein [Xanthomonas arboricola pv. juglandis]